MSDVTKLAEAVGVYRPPSHCADWAAGAALGLAFILPIILGAA